ncbi:MAG: hypothetical protein K2X86_14450 [Cytophagaceae bacterium]|nr:hypothetical protein [Cytophagaceae bacterium]
MKASIIKRVTLENLPSASGVEIIDGIIHIIGDDSPYLYCLDHSLKVIDKVELFKSEDFSTGRIPKKIKPDLECMAPITINNNKHIIVMGSGSAKNRDKGFLVKLPNKYNKKYFVQELSLKSLYELLESNPEIVGDGKLNLEAAASTDDHLILFNRGNKAGKNVILYFSMEEFKVYLLENPEMIPFPKIYSFELPSIKNVPAGFSGASVMDNKLFFTAAVEDTSDPVLDGEVLGSLVGWVDMQRLDFVRGGNREALSEVKDSAIIEENGEIYLGKVESITLFEKDSDTKYIAIAITDDDMGGSELLMLEINL